MLLQGMSTALHRSGLGGTDFNQTDKSIRGHKDLVAYWDFEDGPGYKLKDVTGHDHDLNALAETRWQVTFTATALAGLEDNS